MENKKRWIIFSICLILSIALAILVLTERIEPIDDWFYNTLMEYKSNGLTKYFKYMTFLANPKPLIVIAAFIVIWSVALKKSKSLYLVGTLIAATAINKFLKYTFERPRPDGINLISETGYSFPSGHAMGSVAFYGFLIFLVIKSDLQRWIKWLINISLSFIIVNVCISRVYLGVHYLSDVLAGSLISLSLLLVVIYLIEKFGREPLA